MSGEARPPPKIHPLPPPPPPPLSLPPSSLPCLFPSRETWLAALAGPHVLRRPHLGPWGASLALSPGRPRFVPINPPRQYEPAQTRNGGRSQSAVRLPRRARRGREGGSIRQRAQTSGVPPWGAEPRGGAAIQRRRHQRNNASRRDRTTRRAAPDHARGPRRVLARLRASRGGRPVRREDVCHGSRPRCPATQSCRQTTSSAERSSDACDAPDAIAHPLRPGASTVSTPRPGARSRARPPGGTVGEGRSRRPACARAPGPPRRTGRVAAQRFDREAHAGSAKRCSSGGIRRMPAHKGPQTASPTLELAVDRRAPSARGRAP